MRAIAGRGAAATVVVAAPGHHRHRPTTAPPAARARRPVLSVAATPGDETDPLAALGLAPPLLDGDLDALQAEAGAEVVAASSGASAAPIVASFGADAAADAALRSEDGVALVDAGGWTVLRLGGPGAAGLLHAQSTADFTGRAPPLQPGDAVKTAFATPSGGALATGTALVQEGGSVLLLLGPAGPVGQGGGEAPPDGPAAVAKRLATAAALPADPASTATVDDVSARCAVFGLLGRGAATALARLGARDAVERLRPGAFTLLAGGPGRAPVFLVAGTGLASVAGVTLLADRDSGGAAGLWAALTGPACGAVPAGADVWHAARVEDGCPAPGAELDGRHSPFEAGLGPGWVSVAKGCYLGAESLTKVAGLAGRLKSELWGLRIAPPPGVAPAPGDAVVVVGGGEGEGGEGGSSGGPPLGRLTSVAPALPGVARGGGVLALAFLSPGRTGGPELKAGLRVRVLCGGGVAAADAVVEALPHAERARPSPGKAAGEGAAAAAVQAPPPPAAAAPQDKAAAAAAREAKLAAMKARLDAWQQQQQQGGGE
jgi:folate-binding protein YgfZ